MSPLKSRRSLGGLVVGTLAVALCLGAALALLTSGTGPTSATTAAKPLPAMQLAYAVESKRDGLDQPATVRAWQLSYQDERHWRKELVRSSDPREVGAVMSMQGTTYTEYSAVTKHTLTQEFPEVPMVPEQWLIPDRERFLEGKGYTKVLGASGTRAIYSKTEIHPCLAQPPRSERKLTGVVQPLVCEVNPTFQATEAIVYRTDLGVPIEVTMVVEGITTQRTVVTQLTP